MNKWLAAAAALSWLLTAAHILGGTPQFLTPIVGSDLAADIRAVAAIVWHGVSVALVVSSVVLSGAALNRTWGRGGVGMVAALYLGFVGLFLFYGVRFLGNITGLAQWTAFAVIFALIVIGRRAPSADAEKPAG